MSPADQATLAIVGGIAAEDPALARQVAAAPEVADGISPAELAALTGSDNYFLERLERNFPDIAEIVRSYPWVAGGLSRNTQGKSTGVLAYPLLNQATEGASNDTVLWILERIARNDAALGQRVAGFPWLADGVTRGELGVISDIHKLSRVDLAVATNIAALPWVADDVTDAESHVIRNLTILFSIEAAGFYDGPAMAPLIANQPWLQDGISGADKTRVSALSSACAYESYCRQLIEDAHIRSETLTRTRGNVNIHLISRSPLGPEADQVIRSTEAAVAAVEEFLGLAWQPVDFGVYLEPDYQYFSDTRGFYGGDYVMISDPNDSYVLYHELAHHYSRVGPYWLREGGADFLTGYIYSIQEDATTELQDEANYGFSEGMTLSSRLDFLRELQSNAAVEGFVCRNFAEYP